MSEFKKIGVIGAGAWGTALANCLGRAGHAVTLWALEEDVADDINRNRVNSRYLKDVKDLAAKIVAVNDFEKIFSCDVIFSVLPAQYTRSILQELQGKLKTQPLVLCSKGIEIETGGTLLSEIVTELLPNCPIAVLSGPTFAREVGLGLPAAATLACEDLALSEKLADLFEQTNLRPYLSDDVIGAEVGGAIKNVIAIAAGIIIGKELGDNALAALLTRGLVEITRLGVALGAKPETFMGLSGLGDLTLTCNGSQSRNMSLGVELGKGSTMEKILSSRHSVAEGAHTAKIVVQIARQRSVNLPICQGVYDILYNNVDIDEVIISLLNRNFVKEAA